MSSGFFAPLIAFALSLDPRVRTEISYGKVLPHPIVSRNGDQSVHGIAEAEFRLLPRFTMGFRVMPVFFYFHKNTPPLFAIAPGANHRLFIDPGARSGPYAELSAHLLFQSRHFVGNSSKNCFLTSLGLGYQWEYTGLSTVVKIQHISNANLSHENKGVNAIGLALGYTLFQ